MAKEKTTPLGVVVKISDSGMVETDKGHRVNIKAQKGDKLAMKLGGKPYVQTQVKAPINNINNDEITKAKAELVKINDEITKAKANPIKGEGNKDA